MKRKLIHQNNFFPIGPKYLDRVWATDIYFIVRSRIWFGIDGFYDRHSDDQECIGQLRIFLPFIYIGKSWGKTPSGLSLKDTKYEFGLPWKEDHIM